MFVGLKKGMRDGREEEEMSLFQMHVRGGERGNQLGLVYLKSPGRRHG